MFIVHYKVKFVDGWNFRLWRLNKIDSEIEMKELGRSPQNTHNKRLLIRTSHVCQRLRAAGRNQQVEEYKHTHTRNANQNILKVAFHKVYFIHSRIVFSMARTSKVENNSASSIQCFVFVAVKLMQQKLILMQIKRSLVQ